mmetsp:Transcript_24159/g.34624  ORF Transcript_24159/g.34624 Transcript_24159/m.34624 type:complete len:453 (-) Transcript_24159:123-1481(-)
MSVSFSEALSPRSPNQAEAGDLAAAGLLTFFASGRNLAVEGPEKKSKKTKRLEEEEAPKDGKIKKRLYNKKKGGDREKEGYSNEPKPKRPMSAYNFFFRKERTNARCCVEEASKIIGTKWRELSEKDRSFFKNLAEEDATRYKRDMAEFQSRANKTKQCGQDVPLEESDGSGRLTFVETRTKGVQKLQLPSLERNPNAVETMQKEAEVVKEEKCASNGILEAALSSPGDPVASFIDNHLATRIFSNFAAANHFMNVPRFGCDSSRQLSAPMISSRSLNGASHAFIRDDYLAQLVADSSPPSACLDLDSALRYSQSYLQQPASSLSLMGPQMFPQFGSFSVTSLCNLAHPYENGHTSSIGYNSEEEVLNLGMMQLRALSRLKNNGALLPPLIPQMTAANQFPLAAQLSQIASSESDNFGVYSMNNLLPDMNTMHALIARSSQPMPPDNEHLFY